MKHPEDDLKNISLEEGICVCFIRFATESGLFTDRCRMNTVDSAHRPDTVHFEGFKIFGRSSVPPSKRELTFPGCLEVVETGIKFAM